MVTHGAARGGDCRPRRLRRLRPKHDGRAMRRLLHVYKLALIARRDCEAEGAQRGGKSRGVVTFWQASDEASQRRETRDRIRWKDLTPRLFMHPSRSGGWLDGLTALIPLFCSPTLHYKTHQRKRRKGRTRARVRIGKSGQSGHQDTSYTSLLRVLTASKPSRSVIWWRTWTPVRWPPTTHRPACSSGFASLR